MPGAMKRIEIAQRLQEIETRLSELMPARAKTDAPIVFEDYTGDVGEQKHREWDELWEEKRRLQLLLVSAGE